MQRSGAREVTVGVASPDRWPKASSSTRRVPARPAISTIAARLARGIDALVGLWLVGVTRLAATFSCWQATSSASVSVPGSDEHTSELQSLMRISYAVFCLNKKHTLPTATTTQQVIPHTHHQSTPLHIRR